MSKSILFIDTPENCDKCIFRGRKINKYICKGTQEFIKHISSKPDWCPLCEIPEKYSAFYMEDEILKGKE